MEEKIMEALTDKVRLAVSVIGVGNAGGQVANSLHGNFPVFCINSSEKDLDNRVIQHDIPAFIIGDEARGAGKSRDVAKALLKKNGRKLFESQGFIEMIESSDVIFITGAMAGGTGSGIAPTLLAMLTEMYPKKIFIYYGIMPKMSDSYQALVNTAQCFDEISSQNATYLLADLDYYRNVPNDKAYADIARHIGETIRVLSGEYLHYSSSGMIDENDMRVIVSEPGYMAVYMLNDITQGDIDAKSVQSRLIEQVKRSPVVDIARDGAIKQMGMIVNCPEDMTASAKNGDYSEITEYLGRPYAVFENYALNNGVYGNFSMILSGMSDPAGRLSAIKKVIDEEKPKERKVASILGDTSQYKTSVNVDKLLSGSDDDGEDKAGKKDAVLGKFFD